MAPFRNLIRRGPVERMAAHPLRPVTTRRYHPGLHAVDLRLNGQALAEAEFQRLPA
jgi:hypothetical protein